VPSLHFAVAPVGSVLLAVAVGAVLVAVDDLAAVVDAAGAAAGAVAAAVAGAVADAAAGAVAAVFAAAAGAAVVAAVAEEDFAAFCIPPWPLHVPLPVDVLVVPSAQIVDAPAAGVAGVVGVAGVLVAGAAAGVAAAAGAAFCTPPWPLQAPLPVELLVVPSLQVVVAALSAKLGTVNAKTNSGAAMRLAIVVFFMNLHSLD
jgi:hypothetical protein